MLGKGGAHIAQIRQLSGARVQLQDVSVDCCCCRRRCCYCCCRWTMPALFARWTAAGPGLPSSVHGWLAAQLLSAMLTLPAAARCSCPQEIEGGGRALVVCGQPGQCHTAHSMANAFLSERGCAQPCVGRPAVSRLQQIPLHPLLELHDSHCMVRHTAGIGEVHMATTALKPAPLLPLLLLQAWEGVSLPSPNPCSAEAAARPPKPPEAAALQRMTPPTSLVPVLCPDGSSSFTGSESRLPPLHCRVTRTHPAAALVAAAPAAHPAHRPSSPILAARPCSPLANLFCCLSFAPPRSLLPGALHSTAACTVSV